MMITPLVAQPVPLEHVPTSTIFAGDAESDLEGEGTTFAAPTVDAAEPDSTRMSSEWLDHPGGDSGVSTLNSERVRLLSRQFAAPHGILSPEEQARQLILTERLRRRLPPVSLGEYEALGELVDTVDRIGEEARALFEELGLSEDGPRKATAD